MYVLGITNKLFLKDRYFYNLFFEIDYNGPYSDIEEHILKDFGPYLIIETKKGYHFIFLDIITKQDETLRFLYLRERLFNNGYGRYIDYKHYTEYKKLKEDFKVLRISPKPNNIPRIIKIVDNRSNLRKAGDLFNYYTEISEKAKKHIQIFKEKHGKKILYNIDRRLIIYYTGG